MIYRFEGELSGRRIRVEHSDPEVIAAAVWDACLRMNHHFPLIAALSAFPLQFVDANDSTRILRFVSHAPISLVGPIPGAPTAFAICATKVDEENWYVEWVVPQTSAGAGDVWVYDVTVNNHLMREAA